MNKFFWPFIGLFFIFGVFASCYCYDISWDGQAHLQEAVIQIKEGWNPYTQPNPPAETGDYSMAKIWIKHYPKAVWFFQALLYKITGNIEAGKILNWLVWLLSVFFCNKVLKDLLPANKAMLFSWLIAASPVFLYQSLSFYMDGIAYSSMVILFFTAYSAIVQFSKKNLACLFVSILWVLNIKFNTTVYAILFLFIVFLYLIFIKNTHKILILSTIATGVLIGFFVIGYNPYVVNFWEYGNPFYPILGSRNLHSGITPDVFVGKNPLVQFFLANFTDHYLLTNNNQIKFITSGLFKKSYWRSMSAAEGRIYGFGILFAFSILLSLVVFLIKLFSFFDIKKYYSTNSDGNRSRGGIDRSPEIVWSILFIFYVFYCLVTILITRESWWARYLPHIWLLPCIALIYLAISNRYVIVQYLLIFILLICQFQSVMSFYGNFHFKKLIDQELSEIKTKGGDIEVFFGFFRSSRLKLNAYHIKYIEKSSKESLCGKPKQMTSTSNTFYCGKCK